MISVVLASYNGEKYIKRQIDSIIIQLGANDELIISDDGSTDRTLDIVREMSKNDSRIKVINGPRKGYNKNFENAINYACGDYIFISDQDDIWLPNKVSCIISEFIKNPSIMCIRHDCKVIDDNGNVLIESYNDFRKSNTNYRKNIIKNTFTGCCMCVKREWINKLLPFPDGIFYDCWIGTMSCKHNNVMIINDKLIEWCRHEGTVTNAKKRNSIFWIIKDRVRLYKNIKKRCKNI